MATNADVLKALKTVDDPELGIDIVSLGLIYDIKILNDKVKLIMTLTTPGCPLVPYFRQDIEAKVKQATGLPEIDIELSFDPPWDPNKMSEEARQQLTMLRG